MPMLFWSLTADKQRDLMQFQYDEYGTRLKIPNEPKQEPIDIPVEDLELEEIDKFMRQAPSNRRD